MPKFDFLTNLEDLTKDPVPENIFKGANAELLNKCRSSFVIEATRRMVASIPVIPLTCF